MYVQMEEFVIRRSIVGGVAWLGTPEVSANGSHSPCPLAMASDAILCLYKLHSA